jgi:hypothetical protein
MTVIAALGVILTAAYLLWMLQRVFLGPLNEKYKDCLDLSAREAFTLIPLGIMVVGFGVFPMPLINMTEASISKLQTFVADSNHCFDGRSGEKTTVAPVPDAPPPVRGHETASGSAVPASGTEGAERPSVSVQAEPVVTEPVDQTRLSDPSSDSRG